MISQIFQRWSQASKLFTGPDTFYRDLQVEALEGRVMLSTVQVFASGDTGAEQLTLKVDGNIVDVFNVSQQQQIFTYETPEDLTADQIRIEFLNDQYDPAAGIDRNLRVDLIQIDGINFQTESPGVYSTGTWRSEDGIIPGNGRGEVLHTNGYFQFGSDQSNSGSLVEVVARGDVGNERFALFVKGTAIGSFVTSTTDQTFSYRADTNLSTNDVRVEFFGDQYDPANGVDTNLFVDLIRIDGVTHQTEDVSVFSTGTWRPEDGLTDGFGRGEYLHTDGHFQFGQNQGSTVIEILARGDEGGEQFNLRVAGQTVDTFTTSTGDQLFTWQTVGNVAPSEIQVEFFNAEYDPANGIDTNLVVDFIRLNGTTYQTEADSTYSSGTWLPEDGITGGFGRGEVLHDNGYFQYSSVERNASYRVTFNATWNSTTHPNQFPANPHFSGLIGATHNDFVEFWSPGSVATAGIQDVAELGSKTQFSSEINDAIDGGSAFFEISGGSVDNSPGIVTHEFEAELDYSQVTLIAMLAPSPDWFVGVHGISLLENDGWVDSLTVALAPYDAGTDSGVTFNSPNTVTSPRGVITEIVSGPLQNDGSVAPLGTFTFERIF